MLYGSRLSADGRGSCRRIPHAIGDPTDLPQRIFFLQKAFLISDEPDAENRTYHRRPPSNQYLDIVNDPKLNGDGLSHELGFYREKLLLGEGVLGWWGVVKGLSSDALAALYQYLRNTRDRVLTVLKELAHYFNNLQLMIGRFRPGDLFFQIASEEYNRGMEDLRTIESEQRRGGLQYNSTEEWVVKLQTASITRYPAEFTPKLRSSSSAPVAPTSIMRK